MAATPQSSEPPRRHDFTALHAIYEQAGLVPWARIGEARRALRALCAEQDTERERYRQETIERAREEAIAWFTRETARLQAEIRQMEAERAAAAAAARETDEEMESEAGGE